MAQSPRQRQARNKRRAWWKGRHCAAPDCGAKAKTSCAGWIGNDRGKECRRAICLRHALVISHLIDLCPFCQTRGKIKKRVTRAWIQIQESFPFEAVKGGDREALQIEASAAPSSKRRRNPKTVI